MKEAVATVWGQINFQYECERKNIFNVIWSYPLVIDRNMLWKHDKNTYFVKRTIIFKHTVRNIHKWCWRISQKNAHLWGKKAFVKYKGIFFYGEFSYYLCSTQLPFFLWQLIFGNSNSNIFHTVSNRMPDHMCSKLTKVCVVYRVCLTNAALCKARPFWPNLAFKEQANVSLYWKK